MILLRGLKELGVPIYLTQQYTRGLGMTVPEIVEAAGTREYLEKISYSAAEEVIPKLGGKKSVILCGIESHICVLQTVIDLKSRGFQPVLVTDCISSRKSAGSGNGAGTGETGGRYPYNLRSASV